MLELKVVYVEVLPGGAARRAGECKGKLQALGLTGKSPGKTYQPLRDTAAPTRTLALVATCPSAIVSGSGQLLLLRTGFFGHRSLTAALTGA